jgi:ABC-2 type transport system ATP-binding protein
VTAPALVFEGVSKRYPSAAALSEVTFAVGRGEVFGLIGPDGAGKTTAMRLACGLLRPDGGRVRVMGHDPAADRRAVTRAVGYLSQRSSLYGDLSVDENIAFQAELHGVREYVRLRDRLLEVTRMVPFRARRADRLSGGMKQKLALACTLVHAPDLLLLDEPTTGVDPVARREFWTLLTEFLAEGLTIIMATPALDEAERCGRVALLHEGRLLALDEPAALQAAMNGVLLEVVADTPRPPAAAIAAIDGVLDVQVFGDGAHVRLREDAPHADPERFGRALASRGVPPVSIRRVPPSLEDVFIDRVTRARTE